MVDVFLLCWVFGSQCKIHIHVEGGFKYLTCVYTSNTHIYMCLLQSVCCKPSVSLVNVRTF